MNLSSNRCREQIPVAIVSVKGSVNSWTCRFGTFHEASKALGVQEYSMFGRFSTSAMLGLGLLCAFPMASPVWAADCNRAKADDPLVVLPNFDNCVFHDQSEDAALSVLDHLESLSPSSGSWESFARYNFHDEKYTYARAGINGILEVKGGPKEGEFRLTDFDKLAPYSEFAVAIIRNVGKKQDKEDLTDNDYVLYSFDLADFTHDWVDWNTTQFGLNDRGNYKNATDLKIFVKRLPQEPGPKPVPEPMSVLGLVVFGGTVAMLKRKRS